MRAKLFSGAFPSLLAAVAAFTVAGSVASLAATSASADAASVTLYVNSSGSSSSCTGTGSGACSTLQAAINAAEGSGYAGAAVTIQVDPGTYTENDTVTGGSEQSLTIEQTPGSTGVVTLDGGRAGSVMTVNVSAPVQAVSLNDLTITDGRGQTGGGVDDQGGGTLTVDGSTIADNEAFGYAGGMGGSGGSGSSGGDGTGGGIAVTGSGAVDIIDTTIIQNLASGGAGGAGGPGLFVGPGSPGGPGGSGLGGGVAEVGSGTMSIERSTIVNNSAIGGAGGQGGPGADPIIAGQVGGAGAAGGNGGEGGGGGLDAAAGATTSVRDSTISGNGASGGLGGTGGFGGTGAAGSAAADNGSNPGLTGGAGGNGGDGAAGGSGGSAYGGGVAATGSDSLTVVDSTASGNSVTAGPGGAGGNGGLGATGGSGGGGTPGGTGGAGGNGGNGGVGGAGALAAGGGVYSGGSSTANISEFTDTGNSATGAGGGAGGVGGANGSGGASGGTGGSVGANGLGGNGGSGGSGGDGDGGGELTASAATVLNATIVGDLADLGAGGAAGSGGAGGGTPGSAGSAGSAHGGGLLSAGSAMSVGASIVAGSTATGNPSEGNCFGTPTDLGYNLTDDSSSSCGWSGPNHDLLGQADPVVGVLQNNGGPTETMLPSSPVSIAIPAATSLGGTQVCARTDQRGVPGPLPGQSECTVGAVEDLAGQAPVLSSPTSFTYTLGAGTQPAWPARVTFTGVPTPTVTESGLLPAGVQFSAGAGTGTFDETATFSGTPTATGVSTVSLTADNYLPALSKTVTLTVNQATATSLALTQGTPKVGQTLTFQATVSSEVALKGGAVSFGDSLGAIAGCGSQPLTVVSATRATATCTTQAYGRSGADQANATFSGDSLDLTSSGSTSVQVAAAPAKPSVPKPSIRARLSSPHPKSRTGWWTSPVTVHFSCRAGGGRLATRCPAPVHLTKSGRQLSVRRTIRTTTGQRATVTVRGIHIDLTHPRVRISGPIESRTFVLTAPRAHCHATDRVSGISSCVLSRHTAPAPGGYRVIYRAVATARSGATATAHVLSFVTTVNLGGASLVTPDVWSVTPGHSYVLQVLSRTRPTYMEAAPGGANPTGPHEYFFRTGTVNGIPIWETPINITDGFARFRSWTIGIRIGTTVRRIKLLT